MKFEREERVVRDERKNHVLQKGFDKEKSERLAHMPQFRYRFEKLFKSFLVWHIFMAIYLLVVVICHPETHLIGHINKLKIYLGMNPDNPCLNPVILLNISNIIVFLFNLHIRREKRIWEASLSNENKDVENNAAVNDKCLSISEEKGVVGDTGAHVLEKC